VRADVARRAVGLRLAGIGRTFHNERAQSFALRDVSLDVARHECLVILGPSGSGKTTLLRIVAGLERPEAGTVSFDGRDVTAEPPERRGAGVVFAEDALFPHMSAFENIAYGIPRRDRERVRAAAASMHVEHLLERRANTLSGGERQRVALARALALEPVILLLDEPLARLDAPLRLALRLELMSVLRGGSYTTVLVTHDQSEAMALGDRIAVMREGRIEQLGSPRDVYDRPANLFVASFVGAPAMALLAAASFGSLAPPGAETIGLRADAVLLSASGESAGRVRAVEDLGAEAYAYVETPNGTLVSRLTGPAPGLGENVRLHIDAAKMHSFDAEGRRLAHAERA
jgi:ABC-type sugar transport system ATPase subunit